MYKTGRRAVLLITDVVLVIIMLAACMSLIPPIRNSEPYSDAFAFIVATLVFLTLSLIAATIRVVLIDRVQKKALYSGETSILSTFIERLRVCYSLDDFYEIIGTVLEEKGDCSVLYIDRSNNYVMYNSPSRLTTGKDSMFTLQMNFSDDWKEGYYYLGENLGIVSTPKNARGFFLVHNHKHLYVFCRYTRLFDEAIYKTLYDEYLRFQKRTETISDLSEISSLSQEWQQLANTQRSFLPEVMPSIKGLKLAAYFRPLVNVSGDYYSVLPIDETKTLLMLGDVSGKGLAAALVMGLVMNTVKIMDNKNDLPSIIRAVDKSIKGMKLQDKYTVLFLGIVDTQEMKIRYINASMSDPIIISRSADGYRIKPLSSNCSLVGIIDLPELEVSEQKLFRGDVILMASDGVSEVMDDNGVELGNTKLYQNTIKNSAAKHPREFIDDVVNLILTYNGDKKLRDDVTMLVAKVEG